MHIIVPSLEKHRRKGNMNTHDAVGKSIVYRWTKMVCQWRLWFLYIFTVAFKFSLINFNQIRKFPLKNEIEEIFSQFSRIKSLIFSLHSFGISMMIFYFIVQLPGFSHDFLLRPFPRHVIKFRMKKNRLTPTLGVFSKPQKCAVKTHDSRQIHWIQS